MTSWSQHPRATPPAQPGEPGDDEPALETGLAGLASAVQQKLFDARTVLVFGEVTTALARSVTTQLLALAAASDQPIRVIIHSQGGHVEAGDTIHDVIRFIGPEVKTIGTGWVASAGALIFVAARKEHRFALPNTRFLLHQPLGGMRGPASDIEIETAQILGIRERINRILANATGQTYEKIVKDTDRNLWMSASEAQAYGLVHRVIASTSDL